MKLHSQTTFKIAIIKNSFKNTYLKIRREKYQYLVIFVL